MELENVLDYYNIGIENELKDPGEVLCFCPFHAGDSGEPRMQCNLITNIYHCWSCGAAGNYLGFIIAMEDNVVNYKEAQMFYTGIIVGNNYDLSALKTKFNTLTDNVDVKKIGVQKQQFSNIKELMDLKIIMLYRQIPRWYFIIKHVAEDIAIKTNNPDVFFNWIDPNIEDTMLILDQRISRLEDDLLPSCYNNIARLRSFYNYFLLEMQRLNFLIQTKIPYLI